MGKFGRKPANITTLVFCAVGWLGVVLAPNKEVLLASRGFQGVSMGMVATLGPLLIGEYTSPRNRGAFLMSISVVIGFGVLSTHTMGSYLDWKTTALICIGLSIFTLVLAILSPESPSWLADHGKYDQCRRTFRWLRGDNEEEELEKMIQASEILRNEKNNQPQVSLKVQANNTLRYLRQILKKNEFYKPIIIMFHIYAMAQWCGVNFFVSYVYDYILTAVGHDVNLPVMAISLDVQRIVSSTVALIFIKKVKRRTLIFSVVGLNIVTLLLLSLYTYAKDNNLMPFDNYYNYYIGTALIHLLVLTFSMGALPMSFILAGEIFPLQFKSIAGGFSCLFFSINLFICVKTVPYLINSINIYGLYLLYAGLLIYFLTVLGFILPETKDKTLQDIEEEFRGKTKSMKMEKIPNNLSA